MIIAGEIWKKKNKVPMKEINIKVKNISSRQWPLLLVELNLVAKNWRRFGPVIDIKARNFNKIIKWGRRRHGETE
jgi:hypothetical protein